MKVAFVTPEIQSLVRRTQLAEVAEQLPRTLARLGTQVRVFLPLTLDVRTELLTGLEETARFRVPDVGASAEVVLRTGRLDDVTVHLVDQSRHFRTRHPYGDESGPYADNWRRYAFFARAVLASFEHVGWTPDVLHCFDWTTGLIPLFQKLECGDDHPTRRAGTFFAIHNLAMQGAFEREILPKVGVPHEYFRNVEGVELAGRVNYLKTGAEFATIVGADSPTQAERLQTLDRGDGLEDTFRRRKKELVGVQGGIDYRSWDPANDPLLAATYSASDKDPTGKRKCKTTLQAGLNLDNGPRTLLVAVIGRLDADSGFDVLAEALTPILERNVELVLMGPGPPEIVERLRTLEQTFAGRCRLIDRYDANAAHTLLAGADVLLLPAHYHASNALPAIGMRYGVAPLAYAHSGLGDTVVDAIEKPKKGTGFLFPHYTSDSLLEGLDAVRAVYKKAGDWKAIVKRCLAADFSWDESGKEYLKAYRRVTRRVRGRKS